MIGISLGFSAPAHAVVLAAVAIEATPTTICIGQSARISWTSVNALSVSIDQGFGAVPSSGERYVSPSQTTSYTITGTDETGLPALASATVFVSTTGTCATPTPTPILTPTPVPTPMPTPPVNALSCSAGYGVVNSGDTATFSAWGGTGAYTWSMPEGIPLYGYGQTFSSRVYNQGRYQESRTVVVTSGYQVVSCSITVNPASLVPTWTPVPLPPIQPAGQLGIEKMGRNVTQGQSGEYARVTGRDGDTLTFILHVRSLGGSYLSNVYVSDILPAEFSYIPGSTRVNGVATGDGIVSQGLNVGLLPPFSEALVEFSARVHGPIWRTMTVNNTAQARADGQATYIALLPITLIQHAGIAEVSQVKTGVANSALIAFIVSLVVATLYGVYAYSTMDSLRNALRKRALNFSR